MASNSQKINKETMTLILMKLTKEEKQILTLLHECPVENYVEFIKKRINYPQPIIEELVNTFLKVGLIKKIKIPYGDKEKEWFFFTSKVTKDMIDEETINKKEMGIYFQNEVIYQIEEKKEEDKVMKIKAGKKWIDKNRIIHYDGIILAMPYEARYEKSILFAVMGIKKEKEDNFYLELHAHIGQLPNESYKKSAKIKNQTEKIDEGGDIEAKLIISKELLKKLTRLNEKEIDSAFNSINMGSTYNLMLAIPRLVNLTKDKIIIFRNLPNFINSVNVCNLIFNNKHPIDKSKL